LFQAIKSVPPRALGLASLNEGGLFDADLARLLGIDLES
jgi:hypothetical protein